MIQQNLDITTTDFDLLRQFVQHADESAFAQIVRRHGGMVRGVCQRVLRDPAGADDAFQATLISLSKHAQSLCETEQESESLGSWLYRVAVNFCLQMKRKADSRKRTEATFAQRQSAIEREQAAREEWLPILDEEIGALPPRFQSPLVLCHLQGRTQQDAAAELGLTYATIRRRLQQAKEMLKLRLVRRGFSDAGVLALPLLAYAGQMSAQAAPTAAVTQALLAQISVNGTVAPATGVAVSATATAASASSAGKWLLVSSTLAGALTVGAFAWNFDWLRAGEPVIAKQQTQPDATTVSPRADAAPASIADLQANADVVQETPGPLEVPADAQSGEPPLFTELPETPKLPAATADSVFAMMQPTELAGGDAVSSAIENAPLENKAVVNGNVPAPPAAAKPVPTLASLPKFGANKPQNAAGEGVRKFMQALEAQREEIREKQQQAFSPASIVSGTADEPRVMKGSVTLGKDSRRFFTPEQAVELADWLEQNPLPAGSPLRIVVNIDGVVQKFDAAATAVPVLRAARFADAGK